MSLWFVLIFQKEKDQIVSVIRMRHRLRETLKWFIIVSSLSGSVRDVKRVICSQTSALGQGVVWEFEGDKPNQWTVYDLDTMNIIEDGFLRHSQMNMSALDLRQTHVQLPYVIDFGRMTQVSLSTVTQVCLETCVQHRCV